MTTNIEKMCRKLCELPEQDPDQQIGAKSHWVQTGKVVGSDVEIERQEFPTYRWELYYDDVSKYLLISEAVKIVTAENEKDL